jgi:hypothetical protein
VEKRVRVRVFDFIQLHEESRGRNPTTKGVK